MKTTVAIGEVIERELLNWPDVTAGTHRFGGREFRVGKLEIGHLHGNRVADLPFPRAVRDELVARGEAAVHRYLPNSGWVSFHLRGEQDIPAVLALFRRNYDRLHAIRQRRPAETAFTEDSNQHPTHRSSYE